MHDTQPSTTLLLIRTRTTLKKKNKQKKEETDEWGGGQLGVCININISTTSVPPPLHTHPFPTPSVHVCFPLTTSGCMYNGSYEPRCLLFLSPVPLHQLSVASSGWLPGLVGCLLRLAGPACLSAPHVVFRLLCADGAGENVTPQKQHELSCVNSK